MMIIIISYHYYYNHVNYTQQASRASFVRGVSWRRIANPTETPIAAAELLMEQAGARLGPAIAQRDATGSRLKTMRRC